MKCSPSLFPRGATWMRLCGRIRLKLWLSAWWRLWLYFQRLYTSSNTPVMEKRNGRMTPLHIPNTSDTIANLSHVISSALDLWPLSWAVFVLRATCRCLNCLSGASLEGHGGVCRRNTLLKPLMVNPPFCPACVSVLLCMSIAVSSALQCFIHGAH